MAEKRDTVTFTSIQKSYPPGEKLVISYGLHTELTPSSRDWVGLFRVGWTSSRDYYTFEWAPTPQEQMGQVIFAGRRLPPEDTHFYQVCYVTSDGRVRGASPPFQFLSTSLSCCLDDLELVEVSEDSIMVLQHKESERNVEEELSSVNASMKELEIQHKEVTEKLETIETETVQKSEQLVEQDKQIADLKNQIQTAKETLEKERAQNYELLTAKNDDETQLGIVSQQVADLQVEKNAYQAEIEGLKADLEDVKGQLQIKNNQVADLTQLASARGDEKEQVSEELARVTEELLRARGVQADQLEQLNGKNVEIDQLNIELEARNADNQRLQGEVERLQQEVIIAHQNIAELMGAGPNAVVINQPTTQEPPTLAEPKEIVDKAIYDALLQAYDNMEDYYRSAKKDIETLKASYQLKNDELTARVQQCRDQYEALAKENHELKKGHSGAGNAALQAHIAELEDRNEQMNVNCETAIEELSTRKVELKQKDEHIAEIEEALKQMECEFEKFQDKHDKVVHDKTAKLEEQQQILDEKLGELIAVTQEKTALEKEKTKLETTVGQLRHQLDGLKATAAKPNRQCPVCQTVFPGRMTQADFEHHVEGHFQGQ